MKLGYLQKMIINLGKEKGKITSYDVQKFYPIKEIRRVMFKLVGLGFFKNATDKVSYLEWEYNDERKD